jgi:sigma-B regulation protein RsbU (phosphoserine phosphatase)
LQDVLILHNDPAELSRLSPWLAGLQGSRGWTPSDLFRIELSLSEVLANIIENAFPFGGIHEISVGLEDTRTGSSFTVEDDGIAFDPVSEPGKPMSTRLETAEIGGWGLHLIRHYCDRSAYERSADRNRLVLAFDRDVSDGKAARLRAHPLLMKIPKAELEELVGRCREVEIAPGEVLLAPGEANDTLYFILGGQLQVHIGSRDSGDGFAILPGEIVGEMSIIESKPVSAWVIADLRTTLLAMPEQVFWENFSTLPYATRGLLQLLIARVRKTDAVLQGEFARKVHYEHIQRELSGAAKIQANILPSQEPLLSSDRVRASALIRTAREVGGDFFDAMTLDGHTVAVAVGDVSGKGMPAALFMVRVITLLRTSLRRAQPLSEILPSLNRMLCEGNDELMFVTLAVAVLDTDTGCLAYLNGGHNPPYLSSGGGPFRLGEAPQGPLLGVDPNAVYKVQNTVMKAGDTLVLYTDGVTEAENSLKEQFGSARTAAALDLAGSKGDVKALVGDLAETVTRFAGDAPQSDDITVLALRMA